MTDITTHVAQAVRGECKLVCQEFVFNSKVAEHGKNWYENQESNRDRCLS